MSSEPMVKLVSSDGEEFYLRRTAAEQSRTLRQMLEATAHFPGAEEVPSFRLEDISARVVDLVCQFLDQRLDTNHTMTEFTALDSLDPKSENDRQLVLELLLAADYLDC